MSSSPAWIEVDTAAIANNIAVVQQLLPGTTRLCGVVKADAYGHGVDLVLPVLMAAGIDLIGVTSNDEARTARALGFRGRVIRLRVATREEIEDARDLLIEEWVGGLQHARIVESAARSTRQTIPVHVALNSTGLSRDGIDFGMRAYRADLAAIGRLTALRTVGICAHFPCEEAGDVAAGAAAFRAQSADAVALLASGGRAERHCATSFAAITVPSSRFDMVRIGAALYGDTSAPVTGLRPAIAFVSRIAAINVYPEGRSVGYDRTFVTRRASRLAVVPVGYGSGLHRNLGGRADVLVRGRRARVVDKLAMNSCVIDVTDIPSVQIGDEVVLCGSQGGEQIGFHDLERASGQIAADLYTAWGSLLPRWAVRGSRAVPVRPSAGGPLVWR